MFFLHIRGKSHLYCDLMNSCIIYQAADWHLISDFVCFQRYLNQSLTVTNVH